MDWLILADDDGDTPLIPSAKPAPIPGVSPIVGELMRTGGGTAAVLLAGALISIGNGIAG